MNNQQQQSNVLQVALDSNIYAVSLGQVVHDRENFFITLISGNQGRRFQFSPAHAKRLLMLLQQQMTAYESKFGEVKAELPRAPSGQDAPQTNENKIGFHAQHGPSIM